MNQTKTFPASHFENVSTAGDNEPKKTRSLKRVSWLTTVLDLSSDKRTYDAISRGDIPAECIVRVGRSLRVNPVAVEQWIGVELEY